jgi:hypothetical protein
MLYLTRVFLWALVVAGLAGGASARTMYAGVEGGASRSDLVGNDAPKNTTMRTAFLGGGFVGCDLNGRFGIRAEVLYTQGGVKSGDITTKDSDVHQGNANIDYVDVPVLLDAKFKAGDRMGFDVLAGPSFNFNTKSEVITEDGLDNRSDQTQNFEFGAVVGAGLRYRLSSLSIIANARYAAGVTNVYQDSAGRAYGPEVRNRSVGIMAGLEIPIGSK